MKGWTYEVMEILGIGIKIPAISSLTIIMTMVFLIITFLEFLWVTEEVDLCLKRPANIPLIILNFIVVVIKVVMVEDLDCGLKIPSTLTLSIVEQVLMVMGEVDICRIQVTLSPIIQVGMVDFWVALFIIVLFTKVFMVTREVDIGLRPATFFPITMVDNAVPQQVPLNMLFLGVGEEK